MLGFNARADIVPFPVTLDEDMFDEFAPPIEGVRESRHMVDDAYTSTCMLRWKDRSRQAGGGAVQCKGGMLLWACSPRDVVNGAPWLSDEPGFLVATALSCALSSPPAQAVS